MEFLDGVSLRKLLKAETRLGLERALALIIQVCTGLTHVHARGVVHRDIKPENLMVVKGLNDDGRETEIVKVCDFGIAHAASADDPLVLYAGTPSYMAPELFAGVEPDVQSDVYACGVVLYEMLAGEKPVQGADSRELLKKLYTTRIVPPTQKVPGLDPRADAIVLKCLATDPKARYANMLDLRTDLRGLLGGPAPPSSDARLPAAVAVAVAAAPVVMEAPRVEETGMTPAPASAGAAPDWLERGPVSSQAKADATATEASGPSAAERSRFAKSAAPFLKMLVDVTDPARFAGLIGPLDQKIPLLVQQGHIETVWRVRNALELIAAEGSPRSSQAAAILRIFDHPTVLTPLAEKAIEGHDDREKSASKLVALASAHGARAAYTARLKNLSYESRERFVEVMLEIGPRGAPVIRGALAHLEPHQAKPGVPDLIEDLLRALPRVPDEATGQLLGRLARSEPPAVAALAAAALPKVWGEPARPILVELLVHRDDDVTVAAIRGLCLLNGIDQPVLQRLAANVLGTVAARMPVRLASIEALLQTKGPASKPAREILVHAMATLGGTTEAEDVVIGIAGAFLAGGGDPTLVAERMRSSTGNLRIRIESLLRRHGSK